MTPRPAPSHQCDDAPGILRGRSRVLGYTHPVTTAGRRRAGILASAVGVLLLLTGCTGAQDSEVSDVAQAFHRALAEHDGAEACRLLAPGTRSELEQSSGHPCDKAVLAEKVPASGDLGSVRVYDTMAQVRFTSDTVDDTVFLARFQFGWRVLAAACHRTIADRYDCTVSGA